MAKKDKNENENTKSEPEKKNNETADFDWLKEIKMIPMTSWLRAGIISHIERNNVKITNKKELYENIEKIKGM